MSGDSYKAIFKTNGKTKFLVLPYLESINSNINENDIICKLSSLSENVEFSRIQINVAYQVLNRFPDAQEISIYELKNKNNDEIDDKSGFKLVLILIAFIFALLLAPLIISLGMYNKFLLKDQYSKISNNPKFKAFRLPYIIIGIFLMVILIVLTMVGFILKKELLFKCCLFGLFGTNITYYIIGIVISNSIYKKQLIDGDCLKLENDKNINQSNINSGNINRDKKANDKPFRITALCISILGLLSSCILYLCLNEKTDKEKFEEEEYQKVCHFFTEYGERQSNNYSFSYIIHGDYYLENDVNFEISFNSNDNLFSIFGALNLPNCDYVIKDTFEWGKICESAVIIEYYESDIKLVSEECRDWKEYNDVFFYRPDGFYSYCIDFSNIKSINERESAYSYLDYRKMLLEDFFDSMFHTVYRECYRFCLRNNFLSFFDVGVIIND